MLFSLFPRKKVVYVDLTKALRQTPFYKEPSFWEKITSFIARFIVLSIIIFLIFLCVSLFGILQTNVKISLKLNTELKSKETLINQKEEIIKQISEENARIIKLQSTSPSDSIEIAKIINDILETADGNQFGFLNRVIPHAIRLQVQKGIPASGMIAQAIFESAYGQSELAKKYYNYFGMKCLDGKGFFVNAETIDCGVKVIQPFKVFENPYDGFLGYYDFLTDSDKNGRYNKALSQNNGIKYVEELLKAGYCPDSDYLVHIKEIMKRHKLDLLEKILYKNVENNSIINKSK
jgi:flagellum-specific peptidoglycan hydrolase FlgJ